VASVMRKLMIDMGHNQVGSLAGAAHLLKANAGVQRLAQIGQKPIVANKVNSQLDKYFQYKY